MSDPLDAGPEPSPAAGPGRLFLVPTPLDFGCATQAALSQTLPLGTLRVAAGLGHWISENARSTRAFLKRVSDEVPLRYPLQALQIQELPHGVHKKGDHLGQFDARPLLRAAPHGCDIGLVSEAGMPAVADPGCSVVAAAHQLGLVVTPLSGPAALLLALAASGLNGQDFAFVGYLPQQTQPRQQRILELQNKALTTGQTQLFIETPYRNAALLQALLHHLQPPTRLALSSGLSLPQALSRCQSVRDWRAAPAWPALALPTVFALGR